MKILVAGSAGFIGRHVVRELVGRGHAVIGLDRRAPAEAVAGETVVIADLLDAAALRQAVAAHRPDAAIHLAARTSLKRVPADSDHFAANTVGTSHLIDALREVGTVRRTLYTSSKYVFRGAAVAPHRTYAPDTSYGESKAAMEERVWEADHGTGEWCLVRPTTIWGPGMGSHYQRFLEMIRRGRYVHLGSGGARKHLGYVGNVAVQYARLLEAPAAAVHQKVLYAGDYEARVLRDWAESLRRALDAPPIRSIPLPLARLAGKAGDLLTRCGARKFPFTSFRVRNLIHDDLCDMEPTRRVCGELPVDDETAARLTADWFLGLPPVSR